MITNDEFEELDSLISPLIKKVQLIYHILISNADKISWSPKTIYTYINKELLQARPIDLPRAVHRKPKKYKSIAHKVDTKFRHGRSLDDYGKYLCEHPESVICQIDIVKKRCKCIMTLRFQFGILKEHNDAHSVTQAFQNFYSTMDRDLFHLLFDVILTDNGIKFMYGKHIFDLLNIQYIHPNNVILKHFSYINSSRKKVSKIKIFTNKSEIILHFLHQIGDYNALFSKRTLFSYRHSTFE